MTFRDIVGHARIKALLSSAVARGTVPPTLLFTGPHGVGKSLVAEATAAALNCLSPIHGITETPFDACGKCRSCDRIARGVHVDVLRLEPDERASIKIDVARAMLERVGFRPFEGRRRLVIIDQADALEPQAQNALLKSLEEPPPSSIFVLTTTLPDALLSTVRSRCMRLRFGRIAETDIALLLERDYGFSASDARGAAALADGSVGHALALGAKDLGELRTLALRLLQQAARSTVLTPRLQLAASIVGQSKKDERSREEIGLLLRYLASMLRDVELLNTGGDLRVLANRSLSDDLARLAPSFSGERARDAFGQVDRAIAALARNVGTKVVTEWVAAQL